MSYLSKYSPHSQPSTIETELAAIAEAGFTRLVADHMAAPGGDPDVIWPGQSSLKTTTALEILPVVHDAITKISGRQNTHNPAPLTTEFRQDGVVCIERNSSLPQNANEWQQARQQRAARLGVAYVAASDTDLPLVTAFGQQSDTCLKIDGELARISGIGLKQYPLLQRWLILHDMSRAGRQGFTFDELLQNLQRLGVKGCETYTRRIIRKGNGLFWTLHNGMIYPTSYTILCQRILQRAYDFNLHDLYLYGNHPGQRRDMYIRVSGTAADFEAQILASWYAAHGCPTISRYTLSILLHRDARSIRRMERRAAIQIIYNEAETTDPATVPLTADGELRGDVRFDNGKYTFRLPNTYQAGAIRQHPRKGQGRKAACWFKQWLERSRLPGNSEAGNGDIPGKLNSVSRTYCETDRALNASRKRGNASTLFVADRPRQGRGVVWAVSIGIYSTG